MISNPQPSEHARKMYLTLSQSYRQIQDVFDAIPFRYVKCREDIKTLVASDLVRSIEAKISEQCMIVLNSGSTDQDKSHALAKITEGMAYLVSLVKSKAQKGMPV